MAVRVPGGREVPKNCILELSNAALFDTTKAPLRSCNISGTLKAPLVQIYASDVHYQSQEPLTSFFADWVVPPLPARTRLFGSQVVYFWPGFKASSPEMGFPVLQPVLQFGEGSRSWKLQSWFVDANDERHFPVVTAPAIAVEPGHSITSSMQLSGDIWTVQGINSNTGENSTLRISFANAGDTKYDYAMLVNENINVNTQCDLMPATNNLTFTNVRVNGKVPIWTTRADCAGNKQCDCHNNASVDLNTGDVTLAWVPH